MDKHKQTLCNLGGNALCNIITDENDRKEDIQEEHTKISHDSLCGLAGRTFCNIISDINEISENINELKKAYDENNKEQKHDAICKLAGREFCNIITDMNTISNTLNELEVAITSIGNGDYTTGYNYIIALSKALDTARTNYPASQWKEAGKDGIHQALLAKLKEVENACSEKNDTLIEQKLNELDTIKMRMHNKEWE